MVDTVSPCLKISTDWIITVACKAHDQGSVAAEDTEVMSLVFCLGIWRLQSLWGEFTFYIYTKPNYTQWDFKDNCGTYTQP